jgi:hypothetical protein
MPGNNFKMKQFFTSLNFIELEGLDAECLELIPGLEISNCKKIKSKILTEENIRIIGIIEAEFIRECDAFLYFEFEDDEETFKGRTNLEMLERVLLWLDDILKNLWLIKDNCVSSDTAFLIHVENNVPKEASSLRLQYQFNKSNGKLDKTHFKKNELIEFAKYHDDIENYFYAKKSGSTGFMLQKNFSRLNRGLLFVKQAREARNLAYKISNYCSALETLFSTDNVELSHKLSERIAFFLNNDYNKFKTFKTIKKAYSIRSKLTHGDILDNKQIDGLDELSLEIDGILRFSINKVLKDKALLDIFESPKDVINSYFDKIIFEE